MSSYPVNQSGPVSLVSFDSNANSNNSSNDLLAFYGGSSGAIKAAIQARSSLGISVVGDSTGNETSEWVYLLAEHIAASAPNHKVIYDLWNGGSWNRSVIQDPGGGDRHLISGSNAFEIAALDVPRSGPKLVIELDLKLSDWTSGLSRVLAQQWGTIPNRGWQLALTGTGLLAFQYYESDGTTLRTLFNSTVPVPFADGERGWVRAYLQTDFAPSTTAITYQTSTDGISWSNLGTPEQTSVNTSSTINNPDYPLSLLSTASSNAECYVFRIRNALTGPTVNNLAIDNYSTGSVNNTATYAGDPVILVSNMSVAGWASANATPSLMDNIPNFGTLLSFISLSHNDSYSLGPVGRQFTNGIGVIGSYLLGRCPESSLVIIGQNPENYTKQDNNNRHALRVSKLMAWARKQGYGFIDVFRAFNIDSAGISTLVESNGVHPTSAGKTLWANTVIDSYDKELF